MVRRGKNLWPLILFAIVGWVLVAGMIIGVDPLIIRNIPVANSYGVFLGIGFGALFCTLTLIFRQSRRGLIYSAMIIIFLSLRLTRLDNIVNVALLIMLAIIVDFYFSNR